MSGVALAGAWADAVYHALAHLAVPGPSSLHDARYLAWARAHLPEDAWRPLADDAALLAALYARAPGAHVLHALPALHRDLAQFRATAARPLAALGAGDVADAALLAPLRALDEALVELLRADLGLVAGAWARAWDAVVRPPLEAGAERAAPWLDAARALAPALGRCAVALAFPLGARGRATGGAIHVGAPAPWAALAPEHPALQALHECAVTLAHDEPGARRARAEAGWAPGGGRYVWAEWRALAAVGALVAGTGFERAHARWRAALDTRALDAAARRAGVDADVAALVAALRAG